MKAIATQSSECRRIVSADGERSLCSSRASFKSRVDCTYTLNVHVYETCYACLRIQSNKKTHRRINELQNSI